MIVIRVEHIKVVHNNINNGITEPKLAMTDGNTLVIVKTHNNPEGKLVLFNEYFCYRLAILLDIPMPKSGICLIDDNTVIYNECVTKDKYGYGFYSTYLNLTAPLVETIISMIKNMDVFYRLLLFDHIIFNPDRNLGNLLVQYYKNNIILHVIDHSHVFVNQAIWDSSCLIRAMKEKDYYSTRVLDDNSDLYGMFFRAMTVNEQCFTDLKAVFKEKVTENVLRDFISGMPKEWLPPSRDIDALIRYILYRIEHLDDICTTILKRLSE